MKLFILSCIVWLLVSCEWQANINQQWRDENNIVNGGISLIDTKEDETTMVKIRFKLPDEE